MTQSGEKHFYQLTTYSMNKEQAYLFALEQNGEIYLHHKEKENGTFRGRKRKMLQYAVFVLAENPKTQYIAGKSILLKVSDLEKVVK